MLNINRLSLEEIAHNLRSSNISFLELMQSCQDYYSASEKELNAYKTWAGYEALQTAQHLGALLQRGYDLGPLMGIPISVKDVYAVPNLPTFAGSTQDLGLSWQKAGIFINSLLQQLALISGKTHTVEFALGGLGVNNHWGTPKNPWSKSEHYVPGGSSSGAGVSLCQGSALVALGTDTAGSVRIPAAMTGVVGLKTTQGLWPSNQVVPLSSSLDSLGVLARSVADVNYVYTAVESQLRKKKLVIPSLESCRGLRIGVVENFFWENAEAAVVEEVQLALAKLEQAGAHLVPLNLPNCDAVFTIFQQGGLSVAELGAFLAQNLPTSLANLDPVVQVRLVEGGKVSAAEYLHRKFVLAQASQAAEQIFKQIDVFVHPTLPITAPKLSALSNLDTYQRFNHLALRNPAIANLMGLCALSLPVGLNSAGLPIGMQITAAAYQEEKLLSTALAIESVLGKFFFDAWSY